MEAGKFIHIHQKLSRNQLNTMVKQSVEEMINGLLRAEADQLCGTGRYERNPERQGTCVNPAPSAS